MSALLSECAEQQGTLAGYIVEHGFADIDRREALRLRCVLEERLPLRLNPVCSGLFAATRSPRIVRPSEFSHRWRHNPSAEADPFSSREQHPVCARLSGVGGGGWGRAGPVISSGFAWFL